MSVPYTFTADGIDENSSPESRLFGEFLDNHELEKSVFENNPWLAPPNFKEPLDLGEDRYWVTTSARKHPYWSKFDLPRETQDLQRMRSDFLQYGYCLIDQAMSPMQCALLRDRLLDQAEGERLAGIAQTSAYGQYVNTLVNKGMCFARAIEQDPDVVQGGLVIERLLDEILGQGWLCHAFLANGADPGAYPQALHIDQGALLPILPKEAPMLVNTMYIFEDVSAQNGGTLIIPGSHKAFANAGTGGTIGRLPPTINLEARAGTVMVFDGRLLHGTGVNHTDRQRFVATMSAVKPWIRQQENWIISVRPEVLETASPKLLHRMGFQAVFNAGTVEGFGVNFAQGRVGERAGALKYFRNAMDHGCYQRVGELYAHEGDSLARRDFTVANAMAAAEDKP